MKIRVLGSAGSGGQGKKSPAFLLNDFLLLDAGTASLSLDPQAATQITDIFLSHAHLDHIKGLPFLIDNLSIQKQKRFITIHSGKEVIRDLQKHIFNNRIWPDFSVIPSLDKGLIRYQPLSTKGYVEVRGVRVYASEVDHTVPAYGFLIEDHDKDCLVYSGDSGPTEKIWKRMAGHKVKALIIEVSFPNALKKRASLSGHLTPALLKKELAKMPVLPERIFITHTKFHYQKTIIKELNGLKNLRWEILEDGFEFQI
jgi:cAMP phosphodiesterase